MMGRGRGTPWSVARLSTYNRSLLSLFSFSPYLIHLFNRKRRYHMQSTVLHVSPTNLQLIPFSSLSINIWFTHNTVTQYSSGRSWRSAENQPWQLITTQHSTTSLQQSIESTVSRVHSSPTALFSLQSPMEQRATTERLRAAKTALSGRERWPGGRIIQRELGWKREGIGREGKGLTWSQLGME